MSIGIGCFEASSSFLLKLSAAPVAAASRCSGAQLEETAAQMGGRNSFDLHEFHTSGGGGLGYSGEELSGAFCASRGLHLKQSDEDVVGPDSQAAEGGVRQSEFAAQDHVVAVRSGAFVAYDRHSDQEALEHGRFAGVVVVPTERHAKQALVENLEADRLPAYKRHSDQVLLESRDSLAAANVHPLVPKTIDFIGQHSGHLVKETTELLSLHSSSSHGDERLGDCPEVNADEAVSEAGSQEDMNRLSGLTEGLTSDSETAAASNVDENGPFMGQLRCIKDSESPSLVMDSVEAEINRLRKEHEQLHQQQELLQQKMTCIQMNLARLQGVYLQELEKQQTEGRVMQPSEPGMVQSHHGVQLGAMGVPDTLPQPSTQHHLDEQFALPLMIPEAHNFAPPVSSSNNQHSSLRLFDGYNWRRYGEIVQPGMVHPRVFYGCTNMGCIARKIEERSDDGLMKRMYEGVHNHPVPRKAAKLLETLKRRRRYRR